MSQSSELSVIEKCTITYRHAIAQKVGVLSKSFIAGLLCAMMTACGGSSEGDTGAIGSGGNNSVEREQQNNTDNGSDENETGSTGNNTPGNSSTNDPDETGGNSPETPSLGQNFFGALCASCHGDDGEGTDRGSSLVKMWDETALRNKIDNEMPPTSPVDCSGLCAQTTTAYIMETFTPDQNDNPTTPETPEPFALISTPDNLTDFVPHSISTEARFTGISGTPLIQWYLDNQLVAEGVTYNANFVTPGQHVLALVITGQDDEQVTVTENISVMALNHTVDECSPPIEFYAVRIGPNIVEADCMLCHTENGAARNSGLVFESLAVRGGLTENYRAMASYADTPSLLLGLAGGRGHGGGERLNLGNTNNPLYQDLETFLAIEAETPAECIAP